MAETQIPYIDFSEKALEEGSEGWKALCNQVREACESYGCFQVTYDKIPMNLREETLKSMKNLFDLPEEPKKRNVCIKPFCGYINKSDFMPLYESLGIEHASELLKVKAYTDRIWPEGKPEVCQALNSMSAKLFEFHQLLMKMLFESYGLGKYFASSEVKTANPILRILKYDAPPPTKDSGIGIVPHTDKTLFTILSQDETVHGLEVLSKDGNWIQVKPLPGAFVVFSGEMVRVMTNDRVHAAFHRSVMRGEKERYIYGLFVVPDDDAVIGVLDQLIDEKNPRRFRPFVYSDFVTLFNPTNGNGIDELVPIYATA